jgi:Arm DNA-binding domain
MATVTLTARYLDQLKSHGKRYEVFDAIVPGLAIRISAAGRKTFTLYYRHRGRMRRVGLGRYPDVLLEKARKISTQHRGRIFDGADPASEKQTEHAQDDNTVQALYELYRSRKEKVLRSWSEVRRILEKGTQARPAHNCFGHFCPACREQPHHYGRDETLRRSVAANTAGTTAS